MQTNFSCKKRMLMRMLQKRQLRTQVMTSIPLEFMNASAAQNQLRPFFVSGGGHGSVTFGAAGDSLLLQGVAYQVAMAIEIVRGIDVPPTNPGGGRAVAVSRHDESLREAVERLEKRVEALEKKRGK